MKKSYSTLLVLLLATAAANAEAWVEFRGGGKAGNTSAINLPVEWDTKNGVVWKTSSASGWSSPVIGAGKVYLTMTLPGADADSFELGVAAYNLETGEQIFLKKTFEIKSKFAPKKHKKNGYASPTPVFHDGRLFVHFGHLGTACLSAEGEILWVNRDLDFQPVHGNGGSPELVGDALIFSCDASKAPSVVALNKETGKLMWRHLRDSGAKRKFSFSTPLVITVKGKQQIICPGSGEVSALDPETGKEIWKATYDQGYSVIPRPVYGHGMVFIATGYDRPKVMAIRVDGSGDVTQSHVVWTARKSAPNTPSLLLVGEELYMVSDGGIGSCLDARTGAVHWNERLGGTYSASPLFGDGRIYFQSEGGECVVINAGKTFQVVAKNDLEEKAFASYAVVGSDFIIRTETKLYRIRKGISGPRSPL
ncbi:PQQ-like beta-propeller repeat protein [Verrucomicrobia bacterium]|nr:PQQ-like beta-propeller repeat protein [Verrucomicrobiota bacterium]